MANDNVRTDLKKPPWLKKRISAGGKYQKVTGLLRKGHLHTVCEEARCPNLGECFSSGTATFMILGDHCTRNCRFCAVQHGTPEPPNPEEPQKIAEAVREMKLRYAVITSVTRDDLPDGGAGHFAAVIQAVKALNPETSVEVLIPDFEGSDEDLQIVVAAGPHVLNHNLETVPRLYPDVRPQADYSRSLRVIQRAGEMDSGLMTKSGIMLGLGETGDEVRHVLKGLLVAGCSLLTLGQYLAPSPGHHPVIEYISPESFQTWKKTAIEMGFAGVASGPFVRSSFHAGEMVDTLAK